MDIENRCKKYYYEENMNNILYRRKDEYGVGFVWNVWFIFIYFMKSFSSVIIDVY